MPIRLESDLEKRICKEAKVYGWWPLKLVCVGHRGFPDRWFLKPDRVIIIEFKAPNKRARKLQRWVCDKLVEMGFEVHLDIDDYETAKEILNL